ncbi:sigma-70 family RNA polymerase sigma factor [Aeromicrobium sp. CF4.19]|uniref:sigma-70 family RNA polymerase sigma factor n=1 Tax=Aeromicrobium sp. CF4.19 TaxID=3373082 RepID=UPI003EE71951
MAHLVRDLLTEEPLPPGRERSLALAACSGDPLARDALVRESLRLVALRVRAMGLAPADIDDAMQEGALALLAAVDRFDPDRGARLATFAWPRITGALVRWRASAARTVPVAPDEMPVTAAEPDERDDSAEASALLHALPPGDAQVLWLRHGLDAEGRPRTWVQVGRELGMSASTARRRGERALSRARHTLASMGDRAPGPGADPP